jgi:K+-sensing histidine kinase KdpD
MSINGAKKDYALSLAYHYTKGLYTYGVVDFILDNIFLVILAILVIATLVIILLVRDSNRSKKQMRDQEIARQELEEKNRELAESANESMKARYTYEEMERMLADAGFLIYEHLNAEEADQAFFHAYNQADPSHEMHAPQGVSYCLAVKKM